MVCRDRIVRKFEVHNIPTLLTAGAQVNVIGYDLCDLVGLDNDGMVVVKPAARRQVPVRPEYVITAEWWQAR